MQGSVLSEVLHIVWFDGKTSQGVVFEKLFNPIPFETLALIITVIDFCIDEWSTGNRNKAKFWEKDVIEWHKIFRTDVEKWSSLNPVAVEGIRKKYYMRAARSAGITAQAPGQPNLIGEALQCAREELEGRSGETDSEEEA